jgi:hypothetical protein
MYGKSLFSTNTLRNYSPVLSSTPLYSRARNYFPPSCCLVGNCWWQWCNLQSFKSSKRLAEKRANLDGVKRILGSAPVAIAATCTVPYGLLVSTFHLYQSMSCHWYKVQDNPTCSQRVQKHYVSTVSYHSIDYRYTLVRPCGESCKVNVLVDPKSQLIYTMGNL